MITLAPWWSLLALAGLLPWLGPWQGTNRIQNVLRSILFVLLAAALARPHLAGDSANPQHVMIVDRSDSVDSSMVDAACEQAVAVAERSEGADAHLIVVGSPLSGAIKDAADKAFESVTTLASEGPSGTSQLSAALTHANALIASTNHGSVTLASDGLTTRRDDARAAAVLQQRNLPVHVIALSPKPTMPAPISLRWNQPLRVGSSCEVFATVVAHQSDGSGRITLKNKDGELASATLPNQARSVVQLEFEPAESGFISAELVVSTDVSEKVLPVVLPVLEPHQVMYLGGLQKDGAEKLAKVLGRGFEVRELTETTNEAFDRALSKSDLVFMDDCPADSVGQAAEQQLMHAVTSQGVGLIMSGGRSSFGAGGWHDRPIETLLPVELVQKEEKRDPSTSLVIVIDTSGSMTGVRVQLAKEVARLAMQRLLPHDKVGIVEFYGAKRWAAPIQPASNAIELQRALNRMDAGGGTVILPALEEAFYGLQNVDTRYKHVLVLTDGGVESGDFESLMRRMADEGINVSTVLAGGGYHSEFLVNIANWGKGRFYNVPNRFNLPEILLKQPSTAKLPAYRPGVHRVRARGGSGWWGEVDRRSIPQLAGYVESKARPGSEVLLETTKDSHPVLATWRYGLGRVTALATEPVGEGTRPWRSWPDYGKALARIVERTAADARDPFRFEVTHDGGIVHLHAIRQRPRRSDGVDPQPLARIVDNPAEEESKPLEFAAKSPDRFVAKFPAAPSGETLRIECWASTSSDRPKRLVAPSPVARESNVDPAAALNLVALSAASGGQQYSLEPGGTDLPPLPPSGKSLLPLSSWLFGLALLVFLAEVVWRRLPHETTG